MPEKVRIAVALVSLDLIIFAVVAVAGIAFLLWVLYHLILESRQTRRRRRHSFSHLSSAVDRAGPIPREKKLALILILAVIYGTAQAHSTSPPAPDSQMSALRCCQRA
jgi:hypothetical protein